MLYTPMRHEASARSTSIKVGPRTVTGRNLAHKRRTPAQRALLAASIANGETVVIRPTMRQALAMTGANSAYANAALKLDPAERRAVANGWRPLIPNRPAARQGISDAELRRVARAVGADRLLDAAVEAERT